MNRIGWISASVLLGWCVFAWAVLSPLREDIQQTECDIASLTERLAQLNTVSVPPVRELAPKAVKMTKGVPRLLETAREYGIQLALVETPPAATPREGIHLSGIATLPAWLAWLNGLAAHQDTFLLKRIALSTLTDGRIEFSLYALPALGTPPTRLISTPAGNPFCHAYAYAKASALAALPLLMRYPVHDEILLGVARFGRVRQALIAVPGGRLQAVELGSFVGEERAVVTAITDQGVNLRTAAGDVFMQREPNNNA